MAIGMDSSYMRRSTMETREPSGISRALASRPVALSVSLLRTRRGLFPPTSEKAW